jgi:hypothetical protein
VLSSAKTNRERGPRPQAVNVSPSRIATGGIGAAEVVTLGARAQQQQVLRVLVEDFGGEVMASSLTHRLSFRQGQSQPSFGPGLLDVLRTLHRFGAVSVEANDADDYIVRLLPGGAELYAQ